MDSFAGRIFHLEGGVFGDELKKQHTMHIAVFLKMFFPLEDHHHHHHHHHSSFRNPGTGGISNSWWPSTFLFKPRGHQTPKTRFAETRVVVVDLQRMAWESGSR